MNEEEEYSSLDSYIKMYEKITLTPRQQQQQEQQINDQEDFNPNEEVERYESLSVIIKEKCFVDQSLIIKEINEDQENTNLLFLRPPKFGKTTTLSLMANYFDHQTKDSKEIKEIFQNMKISGYAEEDENFQTHPVIYLKFDRGHLSTPKKVIKEILRVISAAFVFEKKRLDIEESDNNFSEHIQTLQSNIANIKERQIYSMFDFCIDSIEKLPRIIEEKLGKKCYLMIDGIDFHIRNLLINGTTPTDLYEISEFFYRMVKSFSKTKGRRVFMTGVLNCFSKIHSLKFKCYDMMESKYSEYFGFSEKAVEGILKEHFIDKFETINNILKMCNEYFGGYNICSDEFRDKTFKQLLQPASTKKYIEYCIKENELKHPLKFIENGFKENKKMWSFVLESCFEKESLREKIFFFLGLNLNPSKVLPRRKICVSLDCSEEFDFFTGLRNKNTEHWLFFLLAGFGNISGVMSYQKEFMSFIPNRSVKEAYFNGIREFLDEEKQLKDFSSIDLEDKQLVGEILKTTLKQWRDLFPSNNEKNMHAICSLRIGLSKNTTHCTFMEEFCEGQFIIDNGFYPLTEQSSTGVIHEYKNARDANRQKETLESAMWQILQRNYISWLLKKNESSKNKIKEVILRAICFVSFHTKEEMNVGIEEILLTLQEAKSLYKFFASSPIKKIIEMNKGKSFTETGEKILKYTRKDSLEELIKELKKHSEDKMLEYLRKLEDNSNYEYFMNLFKIKADFPELIPLLQRAEESSKTIFELEFSEVYSAGNCITNQEAINLFQQVCDLKENEYYVKVELKNKKADIPESQPRKKAKVDNSENKNNPLKNRTRGKIIQQEMRENEEEEE